MNENDIRAINSSKIGRKVTLSSGKIIIPRIFITDDPCKKCAFEDNEECTKINCVNMYKVFYELKG